MNKMVEKDGLRGLVPSRAKASLDRTFGDYLKEIDPRNNLDAQLALGQTTDHRFRSFLSMCCDYKYRSHSYVNLAKMCGIDLGEFSSFWRKACVQRAIATAQSKAPEVVEDMARDAKTKVIACPRCDGLGWVAAPNDLPSDTPGYRQMTGGSEPKWIRDCPMGCQSGKTTAPGDAHSRDLIMEMSGLIQKGKAIQVNVNNFSGQSHSSAVTALDVVTMDGGDVIDVETVQ